MAKKTSRPHSLCIFFQTTNTVSYFIVFKKPVSQSHHVAVEQEAFVTSQLVGPGQWLPAHCQIAENKKT